MKTYNTEPVKQTLASAKNILILLPQNPDLDITAAGLSLYLSLLSRQLTASIGCSSPMKVGLNRLFGIDKIKTRIGNQNLVISFAYPEDSLEKVSYDKDPQNQKFHLTIEPKAGYQPLDKNQVEFSYTGSNADLVFVIGARSLEDLGDLYKQEKSLLDNKQKNIINITHLDKSAQFGTVNLFDPTASGASEIMAAVIYALGLALEPDIATNLLAGIEQSTDNFSGPNTTADTFEIVSLLMRQGAKKGHLTPVAPTPQAFNPSPFPANKPPAFPSQPPAPRPSDPFPANKPPAFPSQPPAPNTSDLSQPQPDWLKPKVFKSSASE